MIVKNESHIITQTLHTLLEYIPIQYWVICDTGSTDSTKEIITQFFKERNIPGELHDTPWKDFGYNRTVAFEKAYNKSDYAFVWDADDTIDGNFKLPKNLTADWYKFTFGNSSGFRYSRCQLFNNRKKWKYVGVLHEYPSPNEDGIGESVDVLGDYYFVSGRKGSRNNDPEKYQKDAQILEKAFEEAYAANDHLYNRYAFYCAQSYRSCKMNEKAIEYYKKVLTLQNWLQEKYISCLEIYDAYEEMGRPMEGLPYLVESYKYDTKRVECFYRLIKYYCINGLPEMAYTYYTRIQEYFETICKTQTFADKLFVKMDEYVFYLPYYMIIVAERTRRKDICASMIERIFTKAFPNVTTWWIHNLFHNLQFCIDELPLTREFLQSMLDYVDMLRTQHIELKEQHLQTIQRIIDRYRPLLTETPKLLPIPSSPIRIMMTLTTCKRLDLFEKTMNSILNTWTDIDMIDYYYCVDDNSSKEDRAAMVQKYPFFQYYMKSPAEKGHRESMNIIWNKLREVRPTYWIHLEDDWLFYHTGPYVSKAITYLEKYKEQKIHQIVFNKTYGLMYSDIARVGGIVLEDGLVLHEKRDGIVGKNCGYWPHYSLQPSVMRADTAIELGNYDSANTFFERDYAEKYFAAGYKTAFFPSIYSIHIGKQHWETDGKNAYALNAIGQFNTAGAAAAGEEAEAAAPTAGAPNEPLVGTMLQHLHAILAKIRARTPFGIIRPSDGEHSILLGKTLTNCDNWTYTAGDRIQYQLSHALQIVDPNLYIGIPCNTCNKPWNCTQAIYSDFITTFGVPLAQRTYANIFGNSNWKIFADFMKFYTPGFFMVTSGTTHTSELPIKERFLISDKLLNTWNTNGDAETLRLLRFIHGKKGELICFSAGPLSKIWIPMCMESNPHNMYVDVGGSLDIFTKGQSNRHYTTEGHPFAKETCVFNDTGVITAPSILRKNLVYFCVFHNKDYLELLNLVILTLKLFSSTDSMDFLVFTSKEFEPYVQNISSLMSIPLLTHTFAFTTLHESSCARLFIEEYPGIKAYDKILYVDTDIIIQGDLAKLFELDIEEKVYGVEEGTIEHEYHGGWFFDFTTIDKDTPGINAGVLLFKNTPAILGLFRDANAHIADMKKAGKNMPICLDQPFVNYHCAKANRLNSNLLNNYIKIYCIDPPPPPSSPTQISICHFVWPVGNALHKKARMAAHFKHLLHEYASVYPVTHSITKASVLHKSYTWNGGTLTFRDTMVCTTWGNGSYTMLNDTTVDVSWAGYSHVMRFNKDFTSYIGIRKSDLDIVCGNLCDSNVFYNENGIAINHMLLERNEQLLVERYIKPDAVVLELGARYGTVSCAINKKLSNPRNQVSVEPDSRVWNSLKVNKALNKCDFSILCGAISRKPIAMADVNSFEGYGARTVVTEKSSIDTLTLEEVERKYSLRFTTLVADCEGFLEQFYDENTDFFTSLRLIIFECDRPDKCNYDKIKTNLKNKGFSNIVDGFQSVWINNSL